MLRDNWGTWRLGGGVPELKPQLPATLRGSAKDKLRAPAMVSSIAPGDKDVLVVGAFSCSVDQNGSSVATPIALHLKVHAGKITHLELYEDTQRIDRAFGLKDFSKSVKFEELSPDQASAAT